MNELLVDRLKHARAEQGLKQSDVAEKLGLKANTISNWEKGRTEPDIDSFVKLCDIYQIDCASLLSDVYAFKRIGMDISLSEYDHIKKYRALDPHGKEMVDFTLLKEWERSTAEAEKSNVVPLTLKEDATYYVNAAHPIEDATEEDKSFDENLMDDENF